MLVEFSVMCMVMSLLNDSSAGIWNHRRLLADNSGDLFSVAFTLGFLFLREGGVETALEGTHFLMIKMN
jgi:hypothetical protein